jgi:transposase
MDLNARIDDLEKENALLRADLKNAIASIEWFKRQTFGSKSDKIPFIDPAQQLIEISHGDSVVNNTTPPIVNTEPAKIRKGHGTTKLPDCVPRVDEVILLEELKKLCPCCAKPMKFQGFGEKRETSIVPQHVRERVFKYEIYSCEYHPEKVVKAMLPARAIEGVACDHGTLAHIATQKLVMSLPIERQADQLARAGAPIAASTLNMWFIKICMFLIEIAEADRAHIERGMLAYSDDTSFRVQDKTKGKNEVKIHVGNEYLITNGIDAAYMIYCHGRTDASAKEIIGNFQGILVVDGHKSYKKLEGVQVAACWAHVRRYFVEAWKTPETKTGDTRAQKPVELINALFEIDRRCREEKKSPEELHTIRNTEANLILDELKAWLLANASSIPPKSALGKAIAYLDSRWEDACRFLSDPKIPLDNNLSERALRKTVLGRKNFLFAGNVNAAQAIAKAYGVMASCTLCGVDPLKYIEWALDTFANSIIESYADITPRKYVAFLKKNAGDLVVVVDV